MDHQSHTPENSNPPKPRSTTDSEEWGERIETGRQIARGGKDQGHVPGATGDDQTDPRSGQEEPKKEE
ncbi:hypothetical protein [Fimbriiglobus ruber]|uniref:Uncharacterized protein n=1 Tax=Fimbriiglobus ruber TaxID=1908690 RepID=A0A225E111_9BACT|nr:hypothetical protein [Fimbriiglobus ruber]OWK44498.1 hypothetical protein FRUB_02430 [Fimbriiglobus ruber]